MKTPVERGPVMIDIAGLTLTVQDRVRLSHPLVGGIVLFARNYQDRAQLSALCADIHALRDPHLLIVIDQEGGRVQRCREEFTRIPPMRELGFWWDDDPQAATTAARDIGFVLASELLACGVDFSLAPVLDLDWGNSSVVGTRAFHRDPDAVIALAGAVIRGFAAAGMRSCGKHFPGHGWAAADSHVAIPVDERSADELAVDMRPFAALPLDAIMPAHVIYPAIDSRPAGFSPVWHARLRNELHFDGVVFSDDLSMEGASVAGDIVARADAAWSAGCDVLLVCNAPDAVDDLLARWQSAPDAQRAARLARLVPKPGAEPFASPAGEKNPAGTFANPLCGSASHAAGLAAVAAIAQRMAARAV